MSLQDRHYVGAAKSFLGTFTPSRSDPTGPHSYAYLLYGVVLIPLAVLTFASTAAPGTPFAAGYFLAAIAFILHMAAGWLMFGRQEGSMVRALQAAGFTGVVGMGLLFAVQHLAENGGLGTIGKFISYAYGLTSESPFSGKTPLLTFLGYVLSVGVLEEGVKILPVIFLIKTGRVTGWQLACLAGFASGVGFGVAEGIWYHESVYNQLLVGFDGQNHIGVPAGWLVYLVRFVSCVGGHALWTATAAMLIFRRHERSSGTASLVSLLWPVFGVISLHALYDSLLSFDHSIAAFAIDVLSFLLFAAVVEISRGREFSPRLRTAAVATVAVCGLLFAAFPDRLGGSSTFIRSQASPDPSFAPPGIDLLNNRLPVEKLAVMTDEQKRSYETTVVGLAQHIGTFQKLDIGSTRREAVLQLSGLILEIRQKGAKPRVIVEERKPAPATPTGVHNPWDPSRIPPSPSKRVETLDSAEANRLIEELKSLFKSIESEKPEDIAKYTAPAFRFQIEPIQKRLVADKVTESDVAAVEQMASLVPQAEAFITGRHAKMDRLIGIIQLLGYDDSLTDPRLGPAIAAKPSQARYEVPENIKDVMEQPAADAERMRLINERRQKILEAQRPSVSESTRSDEKSLERMPQFKALLKKGTEQEAYALGNELFEAAKRSDNSTALAKLAIDIMDATEAKQDLDFALKAAAEANSLRSGRDVYCLCALARVHYVRGEIDKAIEFQQKAVDTDYPNVGRFFTEDLAKYKAAKK